MLTNENLRSIIPFVRILTNLRGGAFVIDLDLKSAINGEYNVDYVIISLLHKFSHKCVVQAGEQISKYNISFPQAIILHIIFDNEERHLCQKDIVDILGVKGSSISSIINTMSKNDLLERVPCADDARKCIIKGTSKGRDICRKLKSEFESQQESYFNGLSDDEKNCLIKILLKIV